MYMYMYLRIKHSTLYELLKWTEFGWNRVLSDGCCLDVKMFSGKTMAWGEFFKRCCAASYLKTNSPKHSLRYYDHKGILFIFLKIS